MLDAFIIERIRRQREQQTERTPLRIEVPLPPPHDGPPRRSSDDQRDTPNILNEENPYNVDFSV